MKLVIAFACVLGAVACKSKSAGDDKGTGSASASGSGSASASGSGSASASGSGSASASGSGTGTAMVEPDLGSGAAPTTATPEEAKLFADATALKDEMCACPDVACLDKTEEKMKTLGEGIDPSKLTDAAMPKLAALEEEVQVCALKIAEATPLTGANAAEGEKVLAEFRALRDAVCQCADMTCAETKAKDGEALDAKLQTLYPPDEEGQYPPAFEAVMKSASMCFGKLAQNP